MTPPLETIRPLLRTRQIRAFTDEPVADAELAAIADAARWTGSSRNTQPWRFIVIDEPATLRAIHAAGLPQTRALETAMAAIAIALPAEPHDAISHAYDEGRAAERMLIAASMLGLGAGIAWLRSGPLEVVRPLFGLPDAWIVRTVIALGHPSEAARRPKSAPGEARLPRDATVFETRWPSGRE